MIWSRPHNKREFRPKTSWTQFCKVYYEPIINPPTIIISLISTWLPYFVFKVWEAAVVSASSAIIAIYRMRSWIKCKPNQSCSCAVQSCLQENDNICSIYSLTSSLWFMHSWFIKRNIVFAFRILCILVSSIN